MNSIFIVLLALGAVAILVWAVTRRHRSPDEDVIEELPNEEDIKPRIQDNRHPSDDPCRPLDMPDLHDVELCPAIQEAKARLSGLPTPSAPEKPPVVIVTPNPKMTRSDALKAANRNRQAEGRLKAQKAKEALDAKEDPVKVAADCGYKTIKYMREKVRELERGALSE